MIESRQEPAAVSVAPFSIIRLAGRPEVDPPPVGVGVTTGVAVALGDGEGVALGLGVGVGVGVIVGVLGPPVSVSVSELFSGVLSDVSVFAQPIDRVKSRAPIISKHENFICAFIFYLSGGS